MNFDLSPELAELQARVRRYVAEGVGPLEGDARSVRVKCA